jgi:chromosome segregation ATPase
MQKEIKIDKDRIKMAMVETSVKYINDSIIRVESRMKESEDKLDDRFDQVYEKIDTNFKWIMSMIVTGFASMFGVLAHALKWI